MTAWALIAVFLLFAFLMYLGKLPALIALPLMACGLFAAALVPHVGELGGAWPAAQLFFKVTFDDGSTRLIPYAVTILLGATLSEQLRQSGVAESVLRWVSELTGDNKLAAAAGLTLTSALLFTALGGLGAVIMVASLTLPILLSIGVAAETAGCLMLLALSLGGTFNIANWKLYIDVLGLEQKDVFGFALPFGALFLGVTVLFLALNARKGYTSLWAVETGGDARAASGPRRAAYLTPLVPLGLVLSFQAAQLAGWGAYSFPINSALMIGIAFGFVSTWRKGADNVQGLSKAIVEGVRQSAPAVALIVGIGMVINVVWNKDHPFVSAPLQPLLQTITPKSGLGFVLIFTALAPLALYRGPFNLWGMGAGLVALFHGVDGGMAAPAIMALFLSVGQIQGVCDPTNTHNVWIAGHLGVDVMSMTKKTLPYIWGLAALGLCVAAFKYF